MLPLINLIVWLVWCAPVVDIRTYYYMADDNISPMTDKDLGTVITLDRFFSYCKAPRDKVTADREKYHTYLLSILVGLIIW